MGLKAKLSYIPIFKCSLFKKKKKKDIIMDEKAKTLKTFRFFIWGDHFMPFLCDLELKVHCLCDCCHSCACELFFFKRGRKIFIITVFNSWSYI